MEDRLRVPCELRADLAGARRRVYGGSRMFQVHEVSRFIGIKAIGLRIY